MGFGGIMHPMTILSMMSDSRCLTGSIFPGNSTFLPISSKLLLIECFNSKYRVLGYDASNDDIVNDVTFKMAD